MSTVNLTSKQINRSVPQKLRLQNIHGTRERHGDFYLDGKYQFRVTLPNVHGGSGVLSDGWLKCCRVSTLLSTSQYADLVRCPMRSEDYERIIREKLQSRG